ncbi:MAG: tail fiber protein [Bacteroidota bacterium]
MDPMLGEIKMHAGDIIPPDWLPCNGQILEISSYQSLFSILGTLYGGDGRTTFALPNLNGRTPLGTGTGPGLTPRALGRGGGQSEVILRTSQMPSHRHESNQKQQLTQSSTLQASSEFGDSENPDGNYFSKTNQPVYTNDQASATQQSGRVTFLNTQETQEVSKVGKNLGHSNRQPFLTVQFLISTMGTYPSRG